MTTDTSLTVQHRHLALPEQCLFAPTELSIPAAISQSEYTRLGRALSQIDQADALWRCDYALAGIQQFGREQGLALAAEATKLTAFNLYKCSFVAKKFPPAKRYPNLLFSHYRGLLPFPDEFLDGFLARHANTKCSPRNLRALAVAEFGSDPHTKRTEPEKRNVRIRAELWARIQEYSPTQQIHQLVEVILEDWLSTVTPEQEERVAAALAMRGEWNQQRIIAAKNAKKAEKHAAKEQRDAERKASRDNKEAEALARKAERDAWYAAEQVKKAAERAEKEAVRERDRAEKEAARERERAAHKVAKVAEHCAKIARYTESLGKKSQWATQAEVDEVIRLAPHLESYACGCGQFHIRRAVGTSATDHAEPRPTYAERRAAQKAEWNPDTKSYDESSIHIPTQAPGA